LGTAWYKGFLHCYEDVLIRNGSIATDLKWRTWVTAVQNMYENFYKTMVETGIVEVVEEAIQHKAGLPTKYKLTQPKYLVLYMEWGATPIS
jgi:hypothetical protein